MSIIFKLQRNMFQSAKLTVAKNKRSALNAWDILLKYEFLKARFSPKRRLGK